MCTVGAGGGGARGTADVATSAAVATGGGSQGTLSSALLPCAPPAWLASCCCVQWGVAEEACGVEGQLPKGVKVVSSVDCTQCCLHERNVSGTALKHEERHS